jgi:propanol-preferring alcohol dehydrogenase
VIVHREVSNLIYLGTITLVSATTDGPIKVDNLLLNMNRATLRGYACGCSPDMEKCIEYSARVNVKAMVKSFSLEDFAPAYDGVIGNSAKFRNVIVFP